MIEVLDIMAMVLIATAGLLAIGRIVREGSLPDKLLGADLLAVVVATGIAVSAGITGKVYFVDVVVIVAAVGFLGSVTVARFIEKRGARLPGENW